MQLLNTLLQSNPFAAKLQTEELEQKLAEERDKLKGMEPPVLEEPLTLWDNIQQKVTCCCVSYRQCCGAGIGRRFG